MPTDYLHGLNKVLDALEGINGHTVLDKRGELRSQFPSDLDAEGVTIRSNQTWTVSSPRAWP